MKQAYNRGTIGEQDMLKIIALHKKGLKAPTIATCLDGVKENTARRVINAYTYAKADAIDRMVDAINKKDMSIRQVEFAYNYCGKPVPAACYEADAANKAAYAKKAAEEKATRETPDNDSVFLRKVVEHVSGSELGCKDVITCLEKNFVLSTAGIVEQLNRQNDLLREIRDLLS